MSPSSAEKIAEGFRRLARGPGTRTNLFMGIMHVLAGEPSASKFDAAFQGPLSELILPTTIEPMKMYVHESRKYIKAHGYELKYCVTTYLDNLRREQLECKQITQKLIHLRRIAHGQ